ncbi:RCC1-like domain-containing protein [Clostridium sp.]
MFVACGAYYSIGSKKDGILIGWGDNKYGRINIPEEMII